MSTITIDSIDLTNFRYSGSSLALRIYLNNAFISSAGIPQQADSPDGENIWYKSVSCTLVGTTLTIPSFTLDSTTDGLDIVTATYSAFFFNGNNQLGGYDGFERFRLSQFNSSPSWSDIRAFNYTKAFTPDYSTYTKQEIDRLLAASSGLTTLSGDVTTPGGGSAVTTIAANAVTDAKFRTSAGLSLVGRSANSTGNVADITAGADAQILRRSGTSIGFGAVDLSAAAAVGSSILSVANGGTGSATQSFVDLTTNQTSIAGNKAWTGIFQFQSPTTNDTAWSSTGSSPQMFGGLHSTTAVTPTVTLQRTQTSGGTAGVGVHAYNLGFTSTGLVGDGYTLSVLYRHNNDATSLSAGNYFQHAIMGHVVMGASNIIAGKNFYGYNLFKAEALVPNVTYVAVQAEAINNSGTDAPNLATTVFSGVGLNIAGGGTNMNSAALLGEATANSFATSFYNFLYPKRNFIRGVMLDWSAGGLGDVTGSLTFTQSSTSVTGVGTKFTKEFQIGDQLSADGVNWYEVAATPVIDTALTLTSNFLQSTVTDSSVVKTIIAMKMIRPSYIVGTDTVDQYRIIGMDASNRVRLDNDGRTIFAGSTPTQLTDAAGKILSAALNTVQPANGGTGLTAMGTGVATWLGTPSSANLLAAITDETGSGALVFANTPTLVTPLLGTPTSGTLTNCTGYTTANLSGTVAATQGGTGQTSYAVGDLLYASTTTALSKLADVAVGSVLVSGGVSTAPAWSASPTLTTSLTVPSIFGGTAAGSTLTMKGTSGVAADAAYISMNPMVSGAFPGTVFIGAPTTAGITNTIGGFTDCLHLQGADATIAFATIDSYGTGVNSAIVFRSARGTAAAPTATQTSDTIAVFGGRPYYTHDAGGTPQTPNFAAGNRAAITFKAAEVTKSDAQGMFISFETTPTGSTSRALRGQFTSQGSFYVGSGSAALATTATDGFIYVPSCAGTPTGVPTAITGVTPMVYDTSANKIWFYNGSWRGVVVT